MNYILNLPNARFHWPRVIKEVGIEIGWMDNNLNLLQLSFASCWKKKNQCGTMLPRCGPNINCSCLKLHYNATNVQGLPVELFVPFLALRIASSLNLRIDFPFSARRRRTGLWKFSSTSSSWETTATSVLVTVWRWTIKGEMLRYLLQKQQWLKFIATIFRPTSQGSEVRMCFLSSSGKDYGVK